MSLSCREASCDAIQNARDRRFYCMVWRSLEISLSRVCMARMGRCDRNHASSFRNVAGARHSTRCVVHNTSYRVRSHADWKRWRCDHGSRSADHCSRRACATDTYEKQGAATGRGVSCTGLNSGRQAIGLSPHYVVPLPGPAFRALTRTRL